MLDDLKDKLKSGLTPPSEKKEVNSSFFGRKKIVVILVTIILAFCLWMVINLNRNYTIDVDVPIVLGNVSTEQALAEELPDIVVASVSGEGWNLLEMFQDPPRVYIEVSDQQVNLFEQVRRQIHAGTNITVQKVEPLYLQLIMEEKSSKKIPIKSNIDLNFASQYGIVDSIQMQPDSITITGARSIIEDITFWPTDSLQLNNVNSTISRQLSLKEIGSLINLSEQNVTFHAEVAQFTEGEVTVHIEMRNFPFDTNVSFSPSSVNITYLIPVNEYTNMAAQPPVAAYVNYMQLLQDTTGFVTPEIERLIDDSTHLKVQQLQPSQVAYFNIIEN